MPGRGEPAPGRSPVHGYSLAGVGARLCPSGIVTVTPQSFTVTFRASEPRPPGSSRRRTAAVRTAPGPYPPDLSRWAIMGPDHAGSSRTPPRLARRTRPIRQSWARPGFVRAAPALPGTTRIRLPSATAACCDKPQAKLSHLRSNNSASRRTWLSAQSIPHVIVKPASNVVTSAQQVSPAGTRSALIEGLDGPPSDEQFVAPAHRTNVSLWTELRLALQEDITVRTAQNTIFTDTPADARPPRRTRCTTPEPAVCG